MVLWPIKLLRDLPTPPPTTGWLARPRNSDWWDRLLAALRYDLDSDPLPVLPEADHVLCWLRADKQVSSYGSGLKIDDLTGHGYHFANGGSGQAPLIFPNAAGDATGLAFDGANDILVNGVFGGGNNFAHALVGGADNAFTLFFSVYVDSVPADPAQSRLFTAINSESQAQGTLYFGFNDSNFYIFKRGGGSDTGDLWGGPGVTPGYHLITLVHTGTSFTVRLDGADVWTVAADVGSLSGLDLAGIGRSTASGNPCHMKLIEFIAYDIELS